MTQPNYSSTRYYEHISGTTPPDYAMPDDTLKVANPPKSEAYTAILRDVGAMVSSLAECSDVPILVGINGVDTSGKTEFSESLGRHLGDIGTSSTVVHIDDFMKPRHERSSGANEVDRYYNRTIDFDGFERGIAIPIRAGRPAIGAVFDHPHPADDDWRLHHGYIASGPGAVIAEGVFLFRPELRDYFDFTIFLEVPPDRILERARVRDFKWGGEAVMEKYRERYIPTQQMYLNIARPAITSDVVIDMSNVSNPRMVKGKSKKRF